MRLLIVLFMLILTNTLFAQIKIYKDTTFTHDIYGKAGTQHAIEICASDVTVDLGGHTIHRPKDKNYFEGIVLAEGLQNICIKNGVIAGCHYGIVAGVVDSLDINNMIIRNLIPYFDKGDIVGIGIGRPNQTGTRRIRIWNCYFKLRRANHHDAIMLGGCKRVKIHNIKVDSCSVGVNFGGMDTVYSNARVINSTFSNMSNSGVLVRYSDKAFIIDNEFYDSESGIVTDPSQKGYVKNVKIKRNKINNCGYGILLWGTRKSLIEENTITFSKSGQGTWGIALRTQYPPGGTAFISTNNKIRKNNVTGNASDLFYDYTGTPSTGNTWKNNKYGKRDPLCIEIP